MRPVGPVSLALALVCATRAAAQESAPLERGRTYQVPSRVLGAARTIDVSLPSGYATDSTRRYPVLFVLDGGFEQEIAAAIARYYAASDKVPPMIVVGIRNPDRFHELTTTPVGNFRTTIEAPNPGGAESFLGFVGDELVPWVDRTFRTDSMRVLVGHSLGGLFALYAMGQRPALFTGWVLMEPSAWWNDGVELRAALDVLRSPAGRHARLMAVNMEPLGFDTTRWGGDGPMVRQLSTVGETHSSMALAGLTQSLRVMFADFLPAQWRPGTRPIAMLDRYDSLAFRLGKPVPIPDGAFETVFRMSIDSRFYDDAARVIERQERQFGASAATRAMRERLSAAPARERPGFVQLEVPVRRPSPEAARAFLGRWVDAAAPEHRLEVRASGDTIVVYDRNLMANGMPWEGDRPVIQLTPDGVLEWGHPVFRGLAALLVLRGRVNADGTMTITREVRGWVAMGPGPDLARTETMRRAGP